MKQLWIALAQLVMVGTATLPVSAKPPRQVAGSSHVGTASAPTAQQARQTVIAFLTWYKNHMQVANQIQLVNQVAGKPYSVNLKNGERYLAYLKSSNLLTDTYLNGWRTFFNERQAGFRQSPQTEGPPTGFDYDLVMLTQDVDMQLDAIKSLKVKQVNIAKDHAAVRFALLDTYEFRLVRSTDRWLINEILNQSQE